MKTCLIALALFGPAASFADLDGPLQTRNCRSFSLLFLRFYPTGSVLDNGTSELSVGWSCANDYRSYFSVLEDQETSRFELSYRKGLKDGEIQIELPYLIRSGGFMDPIIDWWHKSILGVEPPGRSSAPYGKCVVAIPGYSFGPANGLGDATVRFSKKLSSSLIGTAGVKLPTGNDGGLLGSGGFDAGASLNAKLPLGKGFTVYGQLGYVLQSKARAVSGTRPSIMQEAVSLEWKRNSRDSWIVQWQGENSAIETGNDVSDSQHRVMSLGYRRKLVPGRWLELYFTEDGDFLDYNVPALANVGPDFTIGARYTVRW